MTTPAIELPDEELVQLRRWAVEQCVIHMNYDDAHDIIAEADVLVAFVLGAAVTASPPVAP